MTDPFDSLFAEARRQAVPQIQPPGVPAAAGTVRRRRRVSAAAAAAVAVLAAVGGTALVTRERPATVLTPVSAARQALRAEGAPIVEDAGPVTAGYLKRTNRYLGNLTLTLACAGGGRITMLVEATPNVETGETKPVELSRVSAACAVTPTPAATTFAIAKATSDLRFRLVDTSGVAAGSAFAYRVVSDTGTPLTPDDPRADPKKALNLTGRKVTTAGSLMWVEPVESHMSDNVGNADGRFHLAFACAGAGVAMVEVHEGDRTLVRHDVECQWPPKQVDLPVGRVGSNASTWIGFRTRDGDTAPARMAWAWIRE